jgi:hypothetical protein
VTRVAWTVRPLLAIALAGSLAAPPAFADGKLGRARRKLAPSESGEESPKQGRTSTISTTYDHCGFIEWLFTLCLKDDDDDEDDRGAADLDGAAAPQQLPRTVGDDPPLPPDPAEKGKREKGEGVEGRGREHDHDHDHDHEHERERDEQRGARVAGRLEALYGRGDEGVSWTQVDAQLGIGGDGPSRVVVGIDVLSLYEALPDGGTDTAAIMPLFLGLNLGNDSHQVMLAWGWALTDGLSDSEGRYWLLRYAWTPQLFRSIHLILRPSAQWVLFDAGTLVELRADVGFAVTRHFEVFTGVSHQRLAGEWWQGAHLGLALEL